MTDEIKNERIPYAELKERIALFLVGDADAEPKLLIKQLCIYLEDSVKLNRDMVADTVTHNLNRTKE